MKNKQPENRAIDLYRRLTLLIFSGLFVIFTLAYIIIASVGSDESSTWIGKVQQLFVNVYPNILIIPFTVLCSYLFFRPMSKADQSEQEEQLLEKMKQTVLPLLEEKIVENTKELLIPMIQTTLTHALQDAASLPEMGIIAVKPHLNFAELRDRIVQSKNRVYLFDTWIVYQFNEVERALQETARRQVPLRILLLDPKSPVGKQRAMDLFQDKGRLGHRSKMSTTMLTALYKNAALGNLELRFHSTMPTMQIFICDDRATVGFYFHGQDSQLLPQLEVLIKDGAGQYTSFGKQIEAEFEAKWSLATVVPL